MLAVKYLTDIDGYRTDVVLPFDEYLELIEEIEDLRAIAERKDEVTVSHSEVHRLIESDERLSYQMEKICSQGIASSAKRDCN